MKTKNLHHIVIVGAGFGGLYAAKSLAKSKLPVKITIIDAHNFHLFQPLLYQVATGQLSPEDIAYPIRAIFADHKNVTVIKDLVLAVDLHYNKVVLNDSEIDYDFLIMATGVKPDYFGNSDWAQFAPGLKNIQDALNMRRRVLSVFERAETETLGSGQSASLNFVVIGGGPTGVELTGALAELSRRTLKNEFYFINSEVAKIYLIEAAGNILTGFPEELVEAAESALHDLGVIVRKNCRVLNIDENRVELQTENGTEHIESSAVLWAAGVRSGVANSDFFRNGTTQFDNKGRVTVLDNLTIPGHPNVLVIGDLAHLVGADGNLLPGTAPVAMQQGRYAARFAQNKIRGLKTDPFQYSDKGSLAVIGRNAAIADFGFFKVSGFFAWLMWVFVHIGYLIGYKNKLLVMLKWGWNYVTSKPTARIIYGCGDGQHKPANPQEIDICLQDEINQCP